MNTDQARELAATNWQPHLDRMLLRIRQASENGHRNEKNYVPLAFHPMVSDALVKLGYTVTCHAGGGAYRPPSIYVRW